jgi:uncharacterized membrane protein YhaH (DUF805 family)
LVGCHARHGRRHARRGCRRVCCHCGRRTLSCSSSGRSGRCHACCHRGRGRCPASTWPVLCSSWASSKTLPYSSWVDVAVDIVNGVSRPLPCLSRSLSSWPCHARGCSSWTLCCPLVVLLVVMIVAMIVVDAVLLVVIVVMAVLGCCPRGLPRDRRGIVTLNIVMPSPRSLTHDTILLGSMAVSEVRCLQ